MTLNFSGVLGVLGGQRFHNATLDVDDNAVVLVYADIMSDDKVELTTCDASVQDGVVL